MVVTGFFAQWYQRCRVQLSLELKSMLTSQCQTSSSMNEKGEETDIQSKAKGGETQEKLG